MSPRQGSTTPAATQPRTAANLRAEIKATQATLDEALTRRADMAARLDATNRPGERARLNGDLRRLDGSIEQVREQLAGLNGQLRLIEARASQATTPTPPPTPTPALPPTLPITQFPSVPPTFINTGGSRRFSLDQNTLAFGGFFTALVLAPLAFAVAWRLIRRPAPLMSRDELGESNERLRRMEQAIDTIAVEVERISENQRFLTNAIASESKSREQV